MENRTGLSLSPTGSPYALTLTGDPQNVLGRLFQWLAQLDQDHSLIWVVDEIESTGDHDDDIEASVADTGTLQVLLDRQVIELMATGSVGASPVFRIVVRDGATVDLLGKGDAPTPFELGCQFVAVDPRVFLWE